MSGINLSKGKLKKKKGLGGKKPLSKQQYQKTLSYFISKGVPIGFIQDSIIGGVKDDKSLDLLGRAQSKDQAAYGVKVRNRNKVGPRYFTHSDRSGVKKTYSVEWADKGDVNYRGIKAKEISGRVV
tara:strand:- start:6128 stop:6505 length:378 start_codon:yes stop_codon:yes gene_type:complete